MPELLGYAWEAAALLFVIAVVVGLVHNWLHGNGFGITIVCPNCGDSGEYCPECLGAGVVEDDGETDRAYDRWRDRESGVA